MRNLLAVVFAVFLAGCSLKNFDSNYSHLILDENLSQDIRIDYDWWHGYNEPYLNELVDIAMQNNLNLSKAAINLNKALAQAGLSEANLIPNFSANFGFDINKNLQIGRSSSGYKTSIGLNYEIDIYAKLRDAHRASLWEVNATKFDNEALQLVVINGVVDRFFEILYLQDSIKIHNHALDNYKKLEDITRLKFEFGKAEEISLKQIQSSILSTQNKISNLVKNLNLAKQNLRILLAKKPEFEFKFDEISIADIKFLGVNLDIPLYAISNRPDLKAAIARIEEGLANVKVSQKSFYPSISIGTSLSGSGDSVSEAFRLKFLGGNLSLNLPFLNYSKLSSNLKISKANFESAKLAYTETLIKALNELDTAYANFKLDQEIFENYKKQRENYALISEIYQLKFDVGKAEMKDYLQAKNSELDALSNLILQRYKILQNEINIFKAMAGRAI